MSVAGIFSSSLSNNQLSSQYQLTNSEFQQLGKDLASSNLSSAQSDFSVLQQAFAQPASSPSTSSTSGASASPLQQAFQQLSTDLQSGNLTAAQKDYSAIQQNLQTNLLHRLHHGGGHRFGGWQGAVLSSSDPTTQTGSTTQAQSASSAAQQTYASLAAQLQQSALGSADEDAAITPPVSFVA
jgi:hypothetical protein